MTVIAVKQSQIRGHGVMRTVQLRSTVFCYGLRIIENVCCLTLNFEWYLLPPLLSCPVPFSRPHPHSTWCVPRMIVCSSLQLSNDVPQTDERYMDFARHLEETAAAAPHRMMAGSNPGTSDAHIRYGTTCLNNFQSCIAKSWLPSSPLL